MISENPDDSGWFRMISCLIIRPPRMILQKISGHFCQFWNPWARMMASNFRRKFPPKFCKTLTGRLPLEDGSVRPQTLGKRVSDDLQLSIFRRRKKKNWRKVSVRKYVFRHFWWILEEPDDFWRQNLIPWRILLQVHKFSDLYDAWRSVSVRTIGVNRCVHRR